MSDTSQHVDSSPASQIAGSAEAAVEHMAYSAHLRPVGEHGRAHGRPSSWVLIGVVITSFVVGGVAIILHIWPLLWASLAIILLAIPAGKVTRIMDDTVTWHDPLASQDQSGRASPGPGGAGPGGASSGSPERASGTGVQARE